MLLPSLPFCLPPSLALSFSGSFPSNLLFSFVIHRSNKTYNIFYKTVSLLYFDASQGLSGRYVPWKESQTLESECVVYSEGGGVGAVGQVGSAADLWWAGQRSLSGRTEGPKGVLSCLCWIFQFWR